MTIMVPVTISKFSRQIPTFGYFIFLSLYFTYLLTYLGSWNILEKLSIVQPLQKFPAFYVTGRFITVFTKALHGTLFWARSIHSIPSQPISLKSIIELSTHLRLGLPSCLFHSGLPINILYAFLFAPIRATSPAHLIFLYFIIIIMFDENGYTLLSLRWRTVYFLYTLTYSAFITSVCAGLISIMSSDLSARNRFVMMWYHSSKFFPCWSHLHVAGANIHLMRMSELITL
jgi:hypothetical protein